MSGVTANRRRLVNHLKRSRLKGAVASDSKGMPTPMGTNGGCACARMLDMFRRESDLDYRRALGLSARECRFIQSVNDSSLSLKEIGQVLERYWALKA